MGLLVLFLSVFSLFIGPFIASFFSLLISREISNVVINSQRRSQCMHCGHALAWYDLIPIFSFLLLRGKCRYCHKPIDITNLWAELIGLVAFVCLGISGIRLYLQSEISLANVTNLVITAIFLLALLYLAIYDLYTYSIPAEFTTVILIGALVLSIILNSARIIFHISALSNLVLANTDSLVMAFILGILVYALIVVTKQRGMGTGDVYVVSLIGLLLGWPKSAVAIYLAIIIGGIIGVIVAISKRKMKGLVIPFVPILLIGTSLSIMGGIEIFHLIFYATTF